MNAKERAAVALMRLHSPMSGAAAVDLLAEVLEEYRREGLLEMRQACADHVYRVAQVEEDAVWARTAVLATPLPGESEPT